MSPETQLELGTCETNTFTLLAKDCYVHAFSDSCYQHREYIYFIYMKEQCCCNSAFRDLQRHQRRPGIHNKHYEDPDRPSLEGEHEDY